MNALTSNKNIRKPYAVLCAVITAAFIFGLCLWIYNTIEHRYLHYELYKIALSDLRYYLNLSFLVFAVIASALALIGLGSSAILRKIKPGKNRNGESIEKVLYSLALSLILILIATYAATRFYIEIIGFLKAHPLTARLGGLSSTPRETSIIFLWTLGVTGILVIAFMTYLFSRTGIPVFLKKIITRITGSKATMATGVPIVAFVVLLNIFLPIYKNLNTPDGPNVVLITIDTLRADHLGAYGYERDTSPNIDKLAEDGVLYENAISQAPWTYPSLASMHTSLYPGQIGRFSIRHKISDGLLTISKYLKNNFYETIGVISNQYAGRKFGFSQGFDVFDQHNVLNAESITSQLVTDTAIELINEYGRKPFFLWIHYMDPHAQYNHHPEHAYRNENASNITVPLKEADLNPLTESLTETDLKFIRDTYDEEISYTDEYVGKFINALKDLGLYDNTMIVLTSDHGEELLDRTRFGHVYTLYNELIHVPLIIYNPLENQLRGTRVTQNVEVRNIARTIIEACGITSHDFEGINLLRTSPEKMDGQFIFSQQGKDFGDALSKRAVFMGKWKLIEDLNRGTYELYDLSKDPYEKTNLFDSGQPGISELQNILVSELSGFRPVLVAEPEKTNLNEEDIRQLKALGYVQ